jgi:hypothetical protein
MQVPIGMRTGVSERWLSLTRSPAGNWTIGIGLIVLMAVIGYGSLLTPGKVPFSPYSDILPTTLQHLRTDIMFDDCDVRSQVPPGRDAD